MTTGPPDPVTEKDRVSKSSPPLLSIQVAPSTSLSVQSPPASPTSAQAPPVGSPCDKNYSQLPGPEGTWGDCDRDTYDGHHRLCRRRGLPRKCAGAVSNTRLPTTDAVGRKRTRDREAGMDTSEKTLARRLAVTREKRCRADNLHLAFSCG